MRKRTMGARHSSASNTTLSSSPEREATRDAEPGKNGGEATTPCPLMQASMFAGEIPLLPREVVEEIFLNLPPEQVVNRGRLVCREWKEMVDSAALWRERCRREGYHLRDSSKTPEDWRLFYFLCKKRRNLLKNPRAEGGLREWKIVENGGDKWKVEGIKLPHPNEAVKNIFATSYHMCTKSQLIDLVKEGYTRSFLDQFQPDIKISDWYAPLSSFGSEYHIRVELLDQRKKCIKAFAPATVSFQEWIDKKWHQMTHVFRNYGPGVRYIHFIHGGKDTLFWAGWYGIRVTDSQVEICPYGDT
ncbi:F-box only protein 6-like isoform X2 [Genypterus blacodes]|uniref:F-box only protein 6-like isoform X2 n=1 Tax=Genypterus blacodes TaxID=154954 RepID=UPI003F771526